MFKIVFSADTHGNWCSQCAGRTYATREEAQAAIDADETARPDPHGNTCSVEIVEVTDPLELLCAGHDVSDARRETLARAVELGADTATLETLRDAARVRRNSTTIVLPAGRYEHLSRGKGWARKGRGASAVWGERDDGGYRVGPGRWTVGSSDGFSRKSTTEWSVKHIAVGAETWTIAS